MSFTAKIAALALSGLVLTGGLAASTEKAKAAESALASRPACSPVRRWRALCRRLCRCGRIRQYDAYGNYIGRVRTCA
jgi:hypothetical protein